MRVSFQAWGIRFSLEIFRLGAAPIFRRYRFHPREAALRRRLLSDVHQRLLERSSHG